MTQPVIQVLVGFQSTTGFGQPFILDDAVNGVLNTTGRGTLGGITYVDLTSLVQNINIGRGRSRQLQEFQSGQATVTFWNKERSLDPLNTSSPYWIGSPSTGKTGIQPRLPIIINANGIPIYTGLITSWNLAYDLANNDLMFAQCSDNFTVFANLQLDAHTTTAESTSARINTVLAYSEVNYQGARSVSTGTSTLGGTAASADFSIAQDTNLLNYIQQITQSEQGQVYMSANGTFTWKGRGTVLTASAATFNGDGTGLAFQTLENQFGDTLLYNYIITQSPAGAVQTTSNATSIAQNQTQTYSDTNLLNSTTAEVAGLGDYLLGKYANPVLRFTGLTTELGALTQANQNIALNLDLTSIATVVKNFVTGAPSSSTQVLMVSGISHNITPTSHLVSYNFESTEQLGFFTLDNSFWGTLDNNLLSF